MTLTDNNTASQCANIWAHMMKGNPITPREALTLFGCERLASRIYDLRKRYNMPEIDAIKKETIPVRNRYGKIVRIARYSLNPEFVKKVFGESKPDAMSDFKKLKKFELLENA